MVVVMVAAMTGGLTAGGAASETPLVNSTAPAATATTKAPDESRASSLFLRIMIFLSSKGMFPAGDLNGAAAIGFLASQRT
jgi:hypothetical protein